MEWQTYLKAGERRIAVTVLGPTAAGGEQRPGLVFVHGMFSDQDRYRERARAVVEAYGITCLTMDLSGHGGSDGELGLLRPRDHLEDVVEAYDYLAGRPGVDPARIGVCGASWGGYLSAMLTGQRPVHKLLLRAPGLYADDQIDELLGMPRTAAAVPSLATRSLHTFSGELLVVESEADTTIPRAVIEAYVNSAPNSRHTVLPGAEHALTEPAWQQAFLEEVLTFFGDRAS